MLNSSGFLLGNLSFPAETAVLKQFGRLSGILEFFHSKTRGAIFGKSGSTSN